MSDVDEAVLFVTDAAENYTTSTSRREKTSGVKLLCMSVFSEACWADEDQEVGGTRGDAGPSLCSITTAINSW